MLTNPGADAALDVLRPTARQLATRRAAALAALVAAVATLASAQRD